MKFKLFIFVIVLQIIAIFFISVIIFKKKNDVAGISINPIDQKTIQKNNKTSLKYFYEPVQGEYKEESIFWLNQEVTYNVNADSLYERYDYPIEKANVFRIIAMGDSFTQGLFVNTQDNWVEKLEDSLNSINKCKYKKIEVINLGIPGYDIRYSYERFKLRGQKYKPDLVLWLLQNNDFEEDNEVMREKEAFYIKTMKESGEYDSLLKEGQPYPFVLKMHKDMDEYINKVGVETIASTQKKYLEKMNEIYKHEVVYLFFPGMKQDYKNYLMSINDSKKNQYLELSDIQSSNLQMTFYPYDGHPNEKGYEIIAKNISDYLIKKINCN